MSVYDRITEKIISKLQTGVIPWRQTWETVRPHNPFSGTLYRGANAWLLDGTAYGTINQLNQYGIRVAAGSKADIAIFWKILKLGEKEKPVKPEIEDPESKHVPLLRTYAVFPRGTWDLSGITKAGARLLELSDRETASRPKPETARKILAIPHNKGTGEPSYCRGTDTIDMPEERCFVSPDHYLAAYFHELAHWTGAPHRLAREKGISYGDERYSKEELVAEMTSNFLCHETGINAATEENSASYLANWLSALQNDHRLIVTASGAAQKAADYLLELAGVLVKKPKENEEEK